MRKGMHRAGGSRELLQGDQSPQFAQDRGASVYRAFCAKTRGVLVRWGPCCVCDGWGYRDLALLSLYLSVDLEHFIVKKEKEKKRERGRNHLSKRYVL